VNYPEACPDVNGRNRSSGKVGGLGYYTGIAVGT
jgi:hypothetical protein